MKHCPQCQHEYPDEANECSTDGARLKEILDPRVGQVINSTYLIECNRGRGGGGTVYKARYTEGNNRPIALKFLSVELSQNKEFIDRFWNEANALREASSDNVVEFREIGLTPDGGRFIVMEFVDRNLRDFLSPAPKPLDVELAVEITLGIAEGLRVAHNKGLVHRDIKPENILMARKGDSWVPKVADFGIVATKEGTTRTRIGTLLLTDFYAAPEQWRGLQSDQLDGRADLYALGGVLFEMLTGHRAFSAEDGRSWQELHIEVVPSPPSDLRGELADWEGLDNLVLGLLEKDRENRPKDAAEVIRRLDEIINAHLEKEERDKRDAIAKARLAKIERLRENLRGFDAEIESLYESRRIVAEQLAEAEGRAGEIILEPCLAPAKGIPHVTTRPDAVVSNATGSRQHTSAGVDGEVSRI
jgi:serine/threonine protein kinase